MVALDLVKASNARLKELGPGLVALFIGGTSGIGEYTLKAFVQHSVSPRVYLVGRNGEAAERIIKECQALNKDGKVQFLKADVSELAEVDRVCREIAKREKSVNLLVQTQGNLNMRGRDESVEGLDRKFTLNFYSRMRFISNLLPLLHIASTTNACFSRSISVLGAGHESSVNFEDLELKKTFTGARCAAHTTLMNDLMVDEYSALEPAITFIHSSPGVVNTGVTRELPLWVRAGMKLVMPVLLPFMVSQEETGERHLFLATSAMYPPAKPGQGRFARGVPLGEGTAVAEGANGTPGGYLVNWNGEITGKSKLVTDYRADGISKVVWEHTSKTFERVEKINQDRAPSS